MKRLLIIGALLVLVCPRAAHAIPPPDFLFQFGSQFVQFFSIFFIVLAVVVNGIVRWSGLVVQKAKEHRQTVLISLLLVTVVSVSGAYIVNSVVRAKALRAFDAEVSASLEQKIEQYDAVPEEVATDEIASYLALHPDLPIVLSNDEFVDIDRNAVFVLDAREDEEYAIGRFPGSTHIRFADLLAGAWVDVPIDREVVVTCWSGIRGQEVAEFLRSKDVAARYLEHGADGWVSAGGTWDGEIAFSKVYSAERYKVTYATGAVKAFAADGVVLVDVRDPAVYARKHIDGSINISSIFTPSVALDGLLAQVPPNSTVITVCDDFLSCFDAKIVGIKLEQSGHNFLGRYAAPYEY